MLQTENAINKEDLQSFIKVIPSSWTRGFSKIVVYPSKGNQLLTSFHSTDNVFGIHIPNSYNGSKKEILTEIAVTVQVIEDYGYIPEKLSKSRIKEYLKRWNTISR